ncbi:MAG: ComF family protein [Tissierellales bacterium]
MSRKENLIKKLYKSILNLLFPEEGICFYCDQYCEEIKEDHLCSDCRDKLSFINEEKCPFCGKPIYQVDSSKRCRYCANKTFYFTKVISPLEFSGFLRKAIYKYKYESKPYMYKSFGEFMIKALKKENLETMDFVVPVPLHRTRKGERGYNQAELLAKYISLKMEIPLDVKNLKRIKATKTQNKLGRHEREQNIKDAFKIRDGRVYKDKRILLVDDIFTTGSTVNECSRILIEHGAAEVYVITIATGRYS